MMKLPGRTEYEILDVSAVNCDTKLISSKFIKIASKTYTQIIEWEDLLMISYSKVKIIRFNPLIAKFHFCYNLDCIPFR